MLTGHWNDLKFKQFIRWNYTLILFSSNKSDVFFFNICNYLLRVKFNKRGGCIVMSIVGLGTFGQCLKMKVAFTSVWLMLTEIIHDLD